MRRDTFESKYNNWEGRQLVAVITPKVVGRTAIRVQWAGLEEIREAAAVSTNWASSPADDQFFDGLVTDAEINKAFDEATETPSDKAVEKQSDENKYSSDYDKIEEFIETVVSLLNRGDTICFNFPDGSIAVAAVNTTTVDGYSLIASTIKAINEAWGPQASGMEGWEKPSIYVDYSGKP